MIAYPFAARRYLLLCQRRGQVILAEKAFQGAEALGVTLDGWAYTYMTTL